MVNKNLTSGSGKMGRRDFICKSAMACCLANLPFTASSLAQEKGAKPKTSDVKPTELVAYCGLYCGACDIYQKRISTAGNELKKVLDAYKFADWAKQVPGFEDYSVFEEILDNLIKDFGQCPSCQKGGGDPHCPIPICVKEKGYKTCYECSSFPCEKFKFHESYYIKMLKESNEEIKKIGLEKWCHKQQEIVDKGFRFSDMMTKKSEAEK